MSSRVFSPPAGLQSLLGTKAATANPAELEKAIRGTVDLTHFYLFGKAPVQQAVIIGPTAAVGLIAASFFTVPDGKVWIPIFQAVMYVGVGAGDTGRIKPVLTDNQGVVFQAPSDQIIASTTGTNYITSMPWWLRPVPVQAGFRFGAWAESITVITTGMTGTHSLYYVELDV